MGGLDEKNVFRKNKTALVRRDADDKKEKKKNEPKLRDDYGGANATHAQTKTIRHTDSRRATNTLTDGCRRRSHAHRTHAHAHALALARHIHAHTHTHTRRRPNLLTPTTWPPPRSVRFVRRRFPAWRYSSVWPSSVLYTNVSKNKWKPQLKIGF